MRDWSGQRVVVIGAARQGLALTRYLESHGARVTLTDRRSYEDLRAARQALSDLSVEWVLGDHPAILLQDADLLCPSGGVPLNLPLLTEAKRRGIPLSNDSQIFLEAAPCRVVGITGSAGKTTTTSLAGRIAEKSFSLPDKSSPYSGLWVGGNIGNPLISDLDRMHPGDLVVMELSSFQLELMTCSPQVAAVLNVTPNHLDRHGTMAAYIAAKARILAFQTPEDVAVLGFGDPVARSFQENTRAKIIFFGLEEPASGHMAVYLRGDEIVLRDDRREEALLSRREVNLPGEHNLLNVLAACALAYAANLPVETMRAGVTGFSGLPHRLEFIRSWGGADWYNDSIATAPERAMAAINSFERPIVLLAGGRDKDLPWEEFARLVIKQVDHLILFGEAAEKIVRSLDGISLNGYGDERRPYTIDRFDRLHQAVIAASKIVEKDDIVLLSPGGTSFDEFRDFEERGESFKKWVQELP